MHLTDLVPKSSTFNLRLLKSSLTMRPVTLSDEAWFGETFGVEGISEIFNKVNFGEISKIVYRLLDEESKKKLKKQTVVFYNDEGEETEHTIGGVALLTTLISGWSEKEAILDSLMANLGFSKKDLDEMAEVSGKKKAQ